MSINTPIKSELSAEFLLQRIDLALHAKTVYLLEMIVDELRGRYDSLWPNKLRLRRGALL